MLSVASGLLLVGALAGPPRACAQLVAATNGASGRPAARDDSEARRTTMARALFEEGLRFVDAGRWSDAQDRFERVLELRYSTVAAYNLGLAQARAGHGVVAAATLRKLLTDPTLEPKVREPAVAQLAAVEAHFGWLTLHVPGRCDRCVVLVDREDWPPAVWGVAVPIDPGNHALELRIDSRVLASSQIEVNAAAHVETTLSGRPAALQAAGRDHTSGEAQPAGGRAAWTRSEAPHADAPLLASPWFWGAMGVLVAGAITAVVIETR
jgi:hypothetical protein